MAGQRNADYTATMDYYAQGLVKMSNKLTKRDMVLQFMQEHGSINPMQALNGFGCFSLAQRIHELKKGGHNIITERVSKTGMFGSKVNFAKYHLENSGE